MFRKSVRLSAIVTGVLLSAPMSADAQPTPKVAVVGFPSGERVPSAPDWKQRSPFFQALRDLGWREGHNLSVESRWADGRLERLPEDSRGHETRRPPDRTAHHVRVDLNLKTARALGLTIPQALLLQADQIIE